MRIPLALLTASLALAADPALAQEQAPPAQTCAAMDAALPADLAAWAKPAALKAAASPADLPKAALTPGQAVTAELTAAGQMQYVTQPERPGGSVSKGGIFQLKIDQAGKYGIAISTAAWLDVVDPGKAFVKSQDFGRGPACSTVRKMVNFDLKPGTYTIQLSANPDPTIRILVVRQS